MTELESEEWTHAALVIVVPDDDVASETLPKFSQAAALLSAVPELHEVSFHPALLDPGHLARLQPSLWEIAARVIGDIDAPRIALIVCLPNELVDVPLSGALHEPGVTKITLPDSIVNGSLNPTDLTFELRELANAALMAVANGAGEKRTVFQSLLWPRDPAEGDPLPGYEVGSEARTDNLTPMGEDAKVRQSIPPAVEKMVRGAVDDLFDSWLRSDSLPKEEERHRAANSAELQLVKGTSPGGTALPAPGGEHRAPGDGRAVPAVQTIVQGLSDRFDSWREQRALRRAKELMGIRALDEVAPRDGGHDILYIVQAASPDLSRDVLGVQASALTLLKHELGDDWLTVVVKAEETVERVAGPAPFGTSYRQAKGADHGNRFDLGATCSALVELIHLDAAALARRGRTVDKPIVMFFATAPPIVDSSGDHGYRDLLNASTSVVWMIIGEDKWLRIPDEFKVPGSFVFVAKKDGVARFITEVLDPPLATTDGLADEPGTDESNGRELSED